MIATLLFVRGGVSSSDTVLPVLTHFCIYEGRIQGANGRLSIDAPCPELKFTAITPAEKFLRAIDNCDGEPEIRLTDAGRLVVKHGSFRAVLPTQNTDNFPKAVASKGKRMKVAAGLCKILNKLRPFIATDAERAWASTIYFEPKDEVAFAANNAMIAMVEGKPFKEAIQIPIFCIDELLRLWSQEAWGEPTEYAVDETGVTFFWGDAWLKSQFITAEWPTKTARDWLAMKAKMTALPKKLSNQIDRLLPFCPDPKFPVIHFKGAVISTASGDSEASVELEEALGTGAFHADNLKPMLACSTKVAITDKAALFVGEGFKGVMSLLRL